MRDQPGLQDLRLADGIDLGVLPLAPRPTSATVARREALTVRVLHLFAASDGTYGYRRIHADLDEEGTECYPELGASDHAERGSGRLPATAIQGHQRSRRRGGGRHAGPGEARPG